ASPAAVQTLDSQGPVDDRLADLVDRDRARDGARDLRLVDPPERGQLERRRVALAALVLVRVLEEEAVVAREVEVVDAREHVAVSADHQDRRAAGGEVHRLEAAAVRAADAVALVERK